MASTESVWGIDIGQCALKALKLAETQGQIRIEAFEIIEHPQVLSQLAPNERERAVNAALDQFLSRNDLTGSDVVVSVPSQSGFTRFVKLPPVEEKQVPEIVRFEAEQQIPFSIDEVIWRWQSFRDLDSPDIEVGIFAMKRSDVWETLKRFEDTGIVVDVVQMAPLSLYNFMEFDGQTTDKGATLLVDVGADKTDLVVADGPRIWTRTLQLGGNNFTEALAKAFKLTFSKAEKLKRAAGTSKYARQIFQAMRPVFAELAQEIQRSIGYYTSLHRESRFQRVIGLGNGFRLPGLQKYLEQNLGVPVTRMDGFEKLSPSPAANSPAFTENILSFAVAYGLALQGMEVTKVQTNLLPSESASRRRWAQKRPWFVAAAAMILVALTMIAWRAYADNKALEARGAGFVAASKVVKNYDNLLDDYKRNDGLDKDEEKKILRYKEMNGYRSFVPTLTFLVSEAIKEVATDQRKMNLENRDDLMKIERSKRRVVVIDSLDMKKYEEDLSSIDADTLKAGYEGLAATDSSLSAKRRSIGRMGPGRTERGSIERGSMERGSMERGGMERGSRSSSGTRDGTRGSSSSGKKPDGKRGYLVYLEGSTPLPYIEAAQFLGKIRHKLGELANTKVRNKRGEWVEAFPSTDVTLSVIVDVERGRPQAVTSENRSTPGLGRGMEREERIGSSSFGGRDEFITDPLTGEYTGADTRFVLGWKVVIKDDGLRKDDRAGSAPKTGGAK
ncbi:MAG: type IV pilus assembly protein PilM [Planctomycetota bacterium]|nr:type IV pilus assembly protein PilM [Planctomycetota bacterium]